MRSADPVGRRPRVRRRRPRPAPTSTADARAPFVKICGVTDAAGILAAVRAGADAIGLNFAPGTPRELSIEEGVDARPAGPDRRRPRAGPRRRSSLVTADLPGRRRWPQVVAAVDPDAIQLSGDEPPSARRRRSAGRPGRRCGSRPGDDPDAVDRASPARYLDAGADADPARHRRRAAPGRDRRCASTPALAAAVAREVPITLAGGLHPGNVADALLAIPAIGVDVASGTDAPARARASARARTRCASPLFAKRARDARRHRPNVAVRPDARPRRPARGRRRGPLGQGARLRRALRARRRWSRRSSSSRPRTTRSATTRGSGPSSTTCSPGTPAARPRCTAPTASPQARGSRRRRQAGGRGAGSVAADPRRSGSTSSARTSPTPAPTRSTTRSARRC